MNVSDLLCVIITSTLVSGSTYLLMAIGLTFIFETIRYFNFAHGAFVTFGAYFMWYLLEIAKMDYFVAILLLFPASFVLGFLTQRFLMQILVDREANPLVLILASFCVGNAIESVILLLFGGRLKRLPRLFEGVVQLGGATMSYHKLLILVTSTILSVAFSFILYKTKTGTALRALAQEKEASYLVGINVRRMYAIAVGLSAILAGACGWLMGALLFMTPNFGSGELLWKSFIICTLGGRRAGLRGTILASYFVAFLETTLMRFLPMYYVLPLIFAIVIVALIIKPEGIFVRGGS